MALRSIAVALVLALGTGASAAGEALVAVAANFAEPLERIAPVCEAATGHRVVASVGSTGKLESQIRAGAPFEVLLAADAETPRRLEADGLAAAGTRFTYAVGRIVLWSPRPGWFDGAPDVLRGEGFRHLALANPRTAPYGAAAREALERLGLWKALEPRVVYGESVGQTFQFVSSGNAELGFVALSQIDRPGESSAGSRWLVPAELHAPLDQQAVLLAAGRDDPAAAAFLDCLRSEPAGRIVREFGYGPGGP